MAVAAELACAGTINRRSGASLSVNGLRLPSVSQRTRGWCRRSPAEERITEEHRRKCWRSDRELL